MGTRPQLPEYMDYDSDQLYDEVLGIFYACTMENPSERPSAKKLLELLEKNEENNKAWNDYSHCSYIFKKIKLHLNIVPTYKLANLWSYSVAAIAF